MASISVRRGATLNLTLGFYSDAASTIPINLTGSTLTTIQSTFPTDPTITITNATTGQVSMTMSDTLTSALVAGRDYVLTIKQVQANSSVQLYGPFTFSVSR